MLAHGAGPSRRRRHLQPAGRDGHNPAPSAISAINATMSVSFMMKLYQAWYVVRSATYLQMLTLYSDWNSAHRSMISTLLPSIRFLLAVVAFLLLIYHIISYRIVSYNTIHIIGAFVVVLVLYDTCSKFYSYAYAWYGSVKYYQVLGILQ